MLSGQGREKEAPLPMLRRLRRSQELAVALGTSLGCVSAVLLHGG